jgi:DNA-binding GntR family transcriptional regulator
MSEPAEPAGRADPFADRPSERGPRKYSRHRPRLGAEAASYIRDLIVSGTLPGGDFIRPEVVAQSLGISATPVREGLLELRTEGLVKLEPRRGYVVVPLTGDDIRDVFAGQALLAGELAARAVKHSDAGALATLERLHSDLEAAAGRGDHDELEELNFRFHRAVNLLADSPKLAWLLGVSLSYVPARFHSTIDGWPAATVQDHREVLEAFRNGSSRAARAAMTRHIEHAGELLAVRIESQAAQPAALPELQGPRNAG